MMLKALSNNSLHAMRTKRDDLGSVSLRTNRDDFVCADKSD